MLGGHNTPSDFASLSPRFSELAPLPFGVMTPCESVRVGVQLALARSAAGGAVCAGGVEGVGGACANVAPEPAMINPAMISVRWFIMQGKQPAPPDVPLKSRCPSGRVNDPTVQAVLLQAFT